MTADSITYHRVGIQSYVPKIYSHDQI
uniref:Uncharacterized protein n=1 Tax=Arundo donax TaxID=35708 RepID=A0A0A9AHC4_ARUDO